MRHRADAPNGIMDYLFVKLFLHCREQGFTQFNLGMAPMSGFQAREEASAAERAVHHFFQRLNFLFSFAGLKHYKAKFVTNWEPRYLIYRHVLDLPKLGIALGKVSELGDEEPGVALSENIDLWSLPAKAIMKRKEFDDNDDNHAQAVVGGLRLVSRVDTHGRDIWTDRITR